MMKSNNQTIRVRTKDLVHLLTCPICKNIIKDPINITECLHIFCRKCIYKKVTKEALKRCPVCHIYLGCSPMDKLRPDHNWHTIRETTEPSLREAAKGHELAKKEGEGLEFDKEAKQPEVPCIPLPARRKERSLSSLVNTSKLSKQTVMIRRTKSNARKMSPSQKLTNSIEEPHKSVEEQPGSFNFSMTSSKIAQNNNLQNSSVIDSFKQEQPTKCTGRGAKPFEGMNDLVKPLNILKEAAGITKANKSTSEEHVSKEAPSGTKHDEVNVLKGKAPESTRKVNCNRPPKRAVASEKLNVPPQAIIDAARMQYDKRVNQIWLSLVSSDNQEGDAPLLQMPPCYLSIKNVTLPVSFIKKYLVQKLNLHSEDEVEVNLWGEPLLPSLQLHNLIDLWAQGVPTSERLSASVGGSAKDFVMVLSYARKHPLS